MTLRSLLLSAVLAVTAVPAFAADTFTFDTSHTNITWRANHFGFSNPDGKFVGATGTLVLDETAPANSKVEVSIPTTGLVTGLPLLDEHLKSVDFLDVAQYPTATFVSNKVNVTGKDTATVSGTLTLHGVAKPVVLDVHLNKIGENPMNHLKTAGFSATTTIKRSEFGISAYVPNVSDEIVFSIEVEANVQPAVAPVAH